MPGRGLGRRRPAGGAAAGLGAPSSSRRSRSSIDVIRPGGLANQKAPRHPGRPAHDPRGARRLLARVPRRDVRARGARLADARSTGIGKKTASVAAPVLLRHAAHAGRPPRRAGRRAGSACSRRRRRSTRPTTCSSACSSPTRCTRPTSTSSSTAARSATPSAPSTSAARSATAAGSSTRRRPEAATAPLPILGAMLSGAPAGHGGEAAPDPHRR